MGAASLVCLLSVMAAPAGAAKRHGSWASSSRASSSQASSAAHVPAGDAASVPFGWADFCTRPENDRDCKVASVAAADAVMDARAWSLARKVNVSVNVSIEPMSDLANYGVEDYWTYPDNGKGDCEDYALLKRRELMNLGFPREALLLTVVRDLEGEGHAVLLLKTTSGDFILDNKVNAIRRWSATGYHYVKRQSQENPNVWVSLHAADVPMVASMGR